VNCRWCAEFVVADSRASADNSQAILRPLRETVTVVERELRDREEGRSGRQR
jgi:hypothetical protein